jgi:hypothetical protein
MRDKSRFGIYKTKYDYSHLVGLKVDNITILGIPFAVRFEREDRRRILLVVVQCDCGDIHTRELKNIYRNGKIFKRKSQPLKCSKCRGKTHFQSKTRLYTVWKAMLTRCNSTNPVHKWYSEKNIKVCEDWKDFTNFQNWAYSNGFINQDPQTSSREKLSLDRIDPDKNYCPENCQWITCIENTKKVSTDQKQKLAKVKAERDAYLCLLSTIMWGLSQKDQNESNISKMA